MPLNNTIKREIEVAFAKDAQPVWFRVVKYIVIITTVYFFWRSKTFWVIAAVFLVLAILLHFWYRHKTNGWTKSYGMWKYKKKDEEQQ